jgi:Ran GTPase-activating protein (RanGAP) involved in mRNA processing and transport
MLTKIRESLSRGKKKKNVPDVDDGAWRVNSVEPALELGNTEGSLADKAVKAYVENNYGTAESEVMANAYLVEQAVKDYLGERPDIEGVSLTGCSAVVNEKIVKAVAETPTVAGIVAAECMLRLPSICAVLRAAPQLRYLDLSSNSIGPQALSALAGQLSSHKTLTSLNLANNNLCNYYGDNSNGVLALSDAMKENTSITSLNVSRNALSAPLLVKGHWTVQCRAVQYLADALKANKTLKHLDISQNELALAGVKFICEALKKNTSLTAVNLSGHRDGVFPEGRVFSNTGRVKGAAFLSTAMTANKKLRMVDLSNAALGSKGAASLAKGVGGAKSLTFLDLSRNGIGAAGLKALAAAVARSKSLLNLNLNDNCVGVGLGEACAALTALGDAVRGSPCLRSVELCNNSITTHGLLGAWVHHWKPGPHLKALDLRNNYIEEGARSGTGVMERFKKGGGALCLMEHFAKHGQHVQLLLLPQAPEAATAQRAQQLAHLAQRRVAEGRPAPMPGSDEYDRCFCLAVKSKTMVCGVHGSLAERLAGRDLRPTFGRDNRDVTVL